MIAGAPLGRVTGAAVGTGPAITAVLMAFVVIALGRDPNFLDSYSIKKVNEKEVD